MRLLTTIARWLFIICVPPLLLSAGIGLAFNSLWIYRYSLEKYDASRVTGISEAELEKAAVGLISYFDSRQEFIDITVEKDGAPVTLFNEIEVLHLKDVKGLVWLDYEILLGTLLYALAYGGVSLFWRRRTSLREPQRRLAWSVVTGSGITLGLMVALGMGALFDFDQLLLQFHLISFRNNFWELEPGDALLLFFPGFEATIFVTLTTLAMALVLGGVAWGYLLAKKKDRRVS